jgi:hypothetical protein
MPENFDQRAALAAKHISEGPFTNPLLMSPKSQSLYAYTTNCARLDSGEQVSTVLCSPCAKVLV